MRGLLEIGAYAQCEDLLNAARRISDAMLVALPSNGIIRGSIRIGRRSFVPMR